MQSCGRVPLPAAIWRRCQIQTDYLWLELDLQPNSHILSARVGHDVCPDVQSSCSGAFLTRSVSSTVPWAQSFHLSCHAVSSGYTTRQNKFREQETFQVAFCVCVSLLVFSGVCFFNLKAKAHWHEAQLIIAYSKKSPERGLIMNCVTKIQKGERGNLI